MNAKMRILQLFALFFVISVPTATATAKTDNYFSNIVHISANFTSSYAIDNRGEVWSWGSHYVEQRNGSVTRFDRLSPMKIHGLTGATDVTGMREQTIVLKNDGSVWTWGYHAGKEGVVSSPTQIPQLQNIIKIAAGDSHAIALDETGKLHSWGRNDMGQLGIEYNDPSWHYNPESVVQIDNVVGISAGFEHSIAIKEDGTVWHWGLVFFDESDNWFEFQTTPLQIPELKDIVQVSSSMRENVALQKDGSVWVWDYDHSPKPKKVIGLSDVVAVAGFNAALKSDGTVWTWGVDNRASIVKGLKGIKAIAAGDAYLLALDVNGNVFSFGNNVHGQLGIGSTENNVLKPTIIAKPIEIILSGSHITLNASPIINKDNVVLVPIRGIFEQLGAKVTWSYTERAVYIKSNEQLIKLEVNRNVALVNGEEKELTTEPLIVSDSVMVPLRFIVESLDTEITWDENERKIIISTKDRHRQPD